MYYHFILSRQTNAKIRSFSFSPDLATIEGDKFHLISSRSSLLSHLRNRYGRQWLRTPFTTYKLLGYSFYPFKLLPLEVSQKVDTHLTLCIRPISWPVSQVWRS